MKNKNIFREHGIKDTSSLQLLLWQEGKTVARDIAGPPSKKILERTYDTTFPPYVAIW